jgi:hypothetical protein
MAETGSNIALTGKALDEAKATIKQAILLGDEAIYKTLGQLPSWLDRQMQGLEDTLTLGALRETRRRILVSYQDSVLTWESFKKIAWEAANNGTFDGKTITGQQAVAIVKYIERLVASTQRSLELVVQYAKGTVIWKATGETLSGIVIALGRIGTGLGKLLASLSEAAAGAADVAAKGINWLPWIAGALILGPFVLRSFVAYRKGGAEAAAEAAAADLEAGRAAVGRGARAAWEGGKSLVKRAASGGVLGAKPKRRRRNRA